MDFHAGLEEHPNPAPLQKGNGTCRRSFTAPAAQLVLGMLCFHGMPCILCPVRKGRVEQQTQMQSLAASFSQTTAGKAAQHVLQPSWLKHSRTFSKSSPPERAVSDSSSQAGQTLLLLGCSYLPFLLAQGTQNFCHVCSQHTGSGSCSSHLLLFQQNHRFYGANFIEDQMNPVFSSTSNRSAHSSHPFLPKDVKEQKTNRLKQGRDSKEKKTPRKNSGKCCCSPDLQYRFKDLRRLNSLIVLGSPCNKSLSPKTR